MRLALLVFRPRFLTILSLEIQTDVLDTRALLQHLREASATFRSPQLLRVICLPDSYLLQGKVWCEQRGKTLQSIISQDADIEPLNVLVTVDSFNHSRQADLFEADARERDSFEGIVRIVNQGLPNVLSSSAREAVSVELQLGDVLSTLLIEDFG